MTALAADKQVETRDAGVKAYLMASNTTIYKGGLVCLNASGLAVPAADTSGFTCVGVAFEGMVNPSGGDKKVRVVSGRHFKLTGTGMAQSSVGQVAYVLDDGTVALAGGVVNTIPVGVISEYVSATVVHVHIPLLGGEGAGVAAGIPLVLSGEAHTTDDTLTAGESGTIHSSVGAAGTVVLTLPAATVGLQYYFYVGAAQELRIDPNTTQTISLPSTGVPGAAGKYLTANAIGESVHLVCCTAGSWAVFGFTGTWAAEA